MSTELGCGISRCEYNMTSYLDDEGLGNELDG